MIAYLGKQLSKLFAKFRTKGTKKSITPELKIQWLVNSEDLSTS